MNNKFNLYGRARRVALLKVIAVIIIIVAIVSFLVSFLFKETAYVEKNINYSYLINHFVSKGFACEVLHKDGGKCTKSNETTKYIFFRYDDGFEYIVKTKSYNLSIVHRLNSNDSIKVKTTAYAFDGYKNQEYICEVDKNVLNPIDECVSDDIVLNVESYLGVIEQAQLDLTTAINNSGYSYDKLINDYKWEKK